MESYVLYWLIGCMVVMPKSWGIRDKLLREADNWADDTGEPREIIAVFMAAIILAMTWLWPAIVIGKVASRLRGE